MRRLLVVGRLCAEHRIKAIILMLRGRGGPVCSQLRSAVEGLDSAAYGGSIELLSELVRKSTVRERRALLLKKLQPVAPNWARAIRRRTSPHDTPHVPGDACRAWRWRQLRDELDRRSKLDEISLARHLEALIAELHDCTSHLVERMSWLAQLRRTDLASKQALVGWLDTQKKIGKGTGKRVPKMQAEARRLLSQARTAVPVWIMPLARVAESFDPRQGRFDVVVIDEASPAHYPWRGLDRFL